jgi:secreted trypsin-like serine protease
MVTTYTFSGQLMTTSWTPVANAAITLQSSADKVHWSAFASPVKTNAQGAYTFKGTLKPGSYYFRTFFAGTSSTGPTASRIVRVVLSLNGSSSVSTVVA